MAVITRWSYKRGGRKAGFHCTKQVLLPGWSKIMPLKVQCFPLRFRAWNPSSDISQLVYRPMFIIRDTYNTRTVQYLVIWTLVCQNLLTSLERGVLSVLTIRWSNGTWWCKQAICFSINTCAINKTLPSLIPSPCTAPSQAFSFTWPERHRPRGKMRPSIGTRQNNWDVLAEDYK